MLSPVLDGRWIVTCRTPTYRVPRTTTPLTLPHFQCRLPHRITRRLREHSTHTMGAQEVQALWESMRARGSSAKAPTATPPAAPRAAPLAAASMSTAPDEMSWATLDAFVECVNRGSTALADAAVPARRAELDRLHALVKARARVERMKAHVVTDRKRDTGCAPGAAGRRRRNAGQAAPAAPGGTHRAALHVSRRLTQRLAGRLGAVSTNGGRGGAVAGAARTGVCARAAPLRRARAARAPGARRHGAPRRQ